MLKLLKDMNKRADKLVEEFDKREKARKKGEVIKPEDYPEFTKLEAQNAEKEKAKAEKKAKKGNGKKKEIHGETRGRPRRHVEGSDDDELPTEQYNEKIAETVRQESIERLRLRRAHVYCPVVTTENFEEYRKNRTMYKNLYKLRKDLNMDLVKMILESE
jgi:hypothetical protein